MELYQIKSFIAVADALNLIRAIKNLITSPYKNAVKLSICQNVLTT